MHWHLVHTKPRQERVALDNLRRQGYQCYLPTFPTEKLSHELVRISDTPLFPRYLFIRLGDENSAKSWGPIRSTKGVSRLVSFGTEPARVEEGLVDLLQKREASLQTEPDRLFKPGEPVYLTKGPFSDIEGIYQMADGELRAMVLIEILSKQVVLKVAHASLRKAI